METHLFASNLIFQKHGSGAGITGDAQPVIRIRDLNTIVGSHMLLGIDIDSILLQIGVFAVRNLCMSSRCHIGNFILVQMNQKN